MRRADSRKATDAELDILNILWRNGPSTVRDVHTTLRTLREIRYTTTLKALLVMAEKRLVRRDETTRAHVYEAIPDQAETQKELVCDLVNKVFNGSAVGLMAGALSAKKASPEELDKLRQLLDQAGREKR